MTVETCHLSVGYTPFARICGSLLILFLSLSFRTQAQSPPTGGTTPGALHRFFLGSLWHAAGPTEDTSDSYIEEGLRTLLPTFALEDLRFSRHPSASQLATSVASAAGLPIAPPDLPRAQSTESVLRIVRTSWNDRIDGGSFVKLRLVDLIVGDWSRTSADVVWIPFTDSTGTMWRPRPLTYHNAFTRYDGIGPSLLVNASDGMTSYTEEFPSVDQATFHARFFDRRILGMVARPEWDSVTIDLQRSLKQFLESPQDSPLHIDSSLSYLLKARFLRLKAISEALYRKHARYAAIYGTDGDDSVHIRVQQKQLVTISMGPRLHPEIRTDRTFNSDASDELRLLLGRGRDVVTVEGPSPSGIDVIVESGGASPVSLSRLRPGLPWTTERLRFIVWGRSEYDADIPKSRDWGGSTEFVPWLDLNPDDGIFAGGGPVATTYGYHLSPFRSRFSFLAGMAVRTQGVRVEATADKRGLVSGFAARIQLHVSQVDISNFFGLGNETMIDELRVAAGFFKADQWVLRLQTDIERSITRSWTIRAGGFLQSRRTTPRTASLIESLISTGYTARMNYGGVQLHTEYDSRDGALIPSNAFFFAITSDYFPVMLQNSREFVRFDIDIRGYARPVEDGPILALRGAFSKINGSHPWFESAFIGGNGSVRGFERQRFGGDASAVGAAELRIPLGTAHVVWPFEVGITTFGESGRVFVNGESSNTWHSAGGAGLWLLPARSKYLLYFSVARSAEGWGGYVQLGLPY